MSKAIELVVRTAFVVATPIVSYVSFLVAQKISS